MNKLFTAILISCSILLASVHTNATSVLPPDPFGPGPGLVLAVDTIPLKERYGNYISDPNRNPFDLHDPSIVEQTVEYDPETGYYIITERIGDDYFRPPTYLTFDEYVEWRANKEQQAYFNSLSGVRNDFFTYEAKTDPVEQFDLKGDLADRLFGGNIIDIKPQGNIDIFLGARFQNIQNPNLTLRQQRQGGFDFDMDINMSVNGKIGDKLSLNTNYNTNATFDFENQLKLKFDSETFSEDDIIKSIEAGNVSMPLKSTLIQGSQSLFGLKTELQFGHLRVTALASQQKSKRENITLQGGAQLQYFEVRADEYDANRHFFLSHFNRSIYEEAVSNLPQINSLFRIQRMEVWVTSINNEFQNLREIVAISDLAEYEQFSSQGAADEFMLNSIPPELRDKFGENVLPDNKANRVYRNLVRDSIFTRQLNTVVPTLQSAPYNFQAGRDFEQRRAKRLDPNRYTLIPELGVISLDVALRPDEVLAVAYEYTYNGKPYQVGEFAGDISNYTGDTLSPSSNVLFLKMLKSSTQNVSIPMWDLMMKNIYSVGAYQASEEDFQFDIYYDDPAGGQKRFLPEQGVGNTPLLSLFNLDNLNFYGDPRPDGFFDFLPGLTINVRNGKVIFPVLEPFGESLEKILPPDVYPKYEYNLLYDTTITVAREFQEKNRFILKGSYKSSISSEISLGAFNIPQGSVTVRSGGTTLRENQDYIVDYQIGRVRIINDAYLNSGAPINVSYEDNTLFSFNTKTMVGLRADYELSDHATIGATYLHLWERPFTQKVNYGDDPINNRIYGVDFNFSKEAPLLTRLVDGIPFINTSERSNVDFYVEGAALKPGHSKAINLGNDDSGTVYLDDFDGTSGELDIITPLTSWNTASVPQGNGLFPESALTDDRLIGSNRALLNWYRIARNVSGLNIDNNDEYQRFVPRTEIFRNAPDIPTTFDFRVMDLSYYPDERGTYNFDPPGGSPYSAGLEEVDGDIKLKDPKSRWGGMMRELNINDFEAANYEAIEFWLLNPFIGERDQEGGDLYINLGTVSEDVLKDGLSFYENGLPIEGDVLPTDTSMLGRIPIVPPVINAFANDVDDRRLQDVGLDGFNNEGERMFYSDYLQDLSGSFNAFLVNEIREDPANDDWAYVNDSAFNATTGLFERYRRINHTQFNSPVQTGRNTNNFTDIKFTPDQEDINNDGSTEKSESYFEYKIPLVSDGNKLKLSDFISDTLHYDGDRNRIWYKFKIPIDEYESRVGGISDFRSIKFIRMYLHGFEKPVTLRFATLDLVRSQWRKVTRLFENLPPSPLPPQNTSFDIFEVNLEENAGKTPFPYINPPGIEREQNFQSTFRNDLLNEASLAMNVCNLNAGHSRSIYKIINFDMRVYERLKMFVHAESDQMLEEGDASLFIRLGSDYINNYYEYEIPLTPSEDGSNADYQRVVWPDSNEIDFELKMMKDLKLRRNDQGWPLDDEFVEQDPEQGRNSIKVKGNPNLGLVKTILIGVRNNTNRDDFCGEVWVNELRLTGLDEQGGVAALARLDMQLADFGNLALSGNFNTIGWGALDQKLQQRSREQVTQYDIATNLELGKFFGQESGIRIPFFAQYSSTTKKPQYDPYDLDVELDEKLERADTNTERDSLRKQALDVTTIKSFNFTNIRKEKTGGKSGGTAMPWDISNFSVSYAYTATEHSDPILENDDAVQHTGSLDYRFARGGKYIEPFKKLIKTDKWIKFIKDFNFNPLPNTFTFRTSMDKRLRERKFRFASDEFQRSTSRQFLWDRNYNVNWDLTKSIKLRFTAVNNAVIDELDNNGFDIFGNFVGDEKQHRKDHAWENIQDFGRTKNYIQTVSGSYKLPFDKFGILDWISVDAKYDADYGWARAAINADEFGNSINNGHQESIRATLNFEKLYAKSGFLGRINGKGGSNRNRGSKTDRGGTPGQQVPAKERKTRDGDVSPLAKIFIRPLMLVRRARFNFVRDYSTFVPGLNFEPSMLGMESGFNAPGWGFLLGQQTDDAWLLDHAEQDNWFSGHICQYQEVIRDFSERWDAEVNLEPFKDFQIDINLEKDYSRTRTVLFKNYGISEEPDDLDWGFGTENEFGSYRVSYLALNTLFKYDGEQIDQLFDVFKDNLNTVSGRLNPNGETHPEFGPNYRLGYGPKQQQVVVPAFISAYSEQDPNEVKLNVFDIVPLPNWKLTYNGLNKLPWFKDVFSRVSISHGYSSTLTVNQFTADLRYNEENGSPINAVNLDSTSYDYYSRLTIPTVVISEQLSPLVRIDVSTMNDMTFNFEIRKSRTLGLNPNSQELNETRTTDWTAGFGYTIKDAAIGIFQSKANRRKRGGRNRNTNNQNTRDNQQAGTTNTGSDLRISCDFSIRDNRTKQHRWGLDIRSRDARGQRTIRLSPAVEYDINKNLSLRFFVDYNKTEPYTSQQFPITTTRGGFRLRFTLN